MEQLGPIENDPEYQLIVEVNLDIWKVLELNTHPTIFRQTT